VVLVRFDAFDSTVLLKSTAYEMALGIREAQIYSVSVYKAVDGSTVAFRYPFGVSFTPGANSYTLFRYDSELLTKNPSLGVDDFVDETVVQVFGLGGTTEIRDVCVVTVSGDNCTVSHLDISFRRPEFNAIYYPTSVVSPTSSVSEPVSSGKVILHSTRNPARAWVIEVSVLGQISVYPQ